MVGQKKKNSYKKTRKGKGFSGVQKYEKSKDKRALAATNDRHNDSECVGSSRKKMKLQNDATHVCHADQLDDVNSDEYRLINTKHLSSALSDIHICEEGID